MFGYIKVLVMCMFTLLYNEAPKIEHSTKAVHIQHREDVQALGRIFYATGSQGELVSPDIDPLILASMSWEESRYRQHGPDGDPRFRGGYRHCPKPGPCYSPRTPVIKIGQSIGPMQISRAAPRWVAIWEKNNSNEDAQAWHGLTVTQLREPELNVAFAYMLLKKFKYNCGGSPGVWIDAYGRGRCGSKRYIGKKAKKRCNNVNSFIQKMKSQYPDLEVPANFDCMTWLPPKLPK